MRPKMWGKGSVRKSEAYRVDRSRFPLLLLLAILTGVLAGVSAPPYRAQAAATDYFGAVQEIYISYYQRPADPDGLLYWAAWLDSANGNLNEMIQVFADSPESQVLYGTINSNNISNVVDSIYLALFNRHADAEGKAYYVDAFNTGRSIPATIALDILYGAQGQDRVCVDNKLIAANLFTETIQYLQLPLSGDAFAAAARTFLAQVTFDSTTLPALSATIQFVQARSAASGQVILAWDPNEEPTVAGYKIYYGTVSGSYSWCVDAGNVTTFTLSDLSVGVVYYSVATAYDTSRLESGYSNEVSFQAQ
jgi:hypothetical protein